jgi:hypothetical protein
MYCITIRHGTENLRHKDLFHTLHLKSGMVLTIVLLTTAEPKSRVLMDFYY